MKRSARDGYFFALQSGWVGFFLQSTAGFCCWGSLGPAKAMLLIPKPSAQSNATMLFITTSLKFPFIKGHQARATYSELHARRMILMTISWLALKILSFP